MAISPSGDGSYRLAKSINRQIANYKLNGHPGIVTKEMDSPAFEYRSSNEDF